MLYYAHLLFSLCVVIFYCDNNMINKQPGTDLNGRPRRLDFWLGYHISKSRGPVGEYDFQVFLGHNYSKLTLNGRFTIQTN